MKKFKTDHDMVLEQIPIGRENAIKMKDLKFFTGLSRRRIGECIRDLRQDYPICSTSVSPGGYWLGNAHDCRRMVQDLNAKAYSYFNTASKLKKLAEEMDTVHTQNEAR